MLFEELREKIYTALQEAEQLDLEAEDNNQSIAKYCENLMQTQIYLQELYAEIQDHLESCIDENKTGEMVIIAPSRMIH